MSSGELSQRPDITITQLRDVVEVEVGSSKPVRLSLRDSYSIRLAVSKFIERVEAKRPDELTPSFNSAVDFIHAAREAAYECLIASTKGSFDNVAAAWDLVGQYLKRRPFGEQPAYVEIAIFGSDYLPWEWVAFPRPRQTEPVAADAQSQRCEDRVAELRREVDDVLGFAAVVRRAYLEVEQPDAKASEARRYLSPDRGRLQIRFMRYPGLAGSSEQEGYFNAHHDVRLNGPIPDAIHGFPVTLATQLLNPWVDAISGQRLGGPDQVIHMHCHHEAVRDDPSDHNKPWTISRLVLQDEPPLRIDFDELEKELSSPYARLSVGSIDRPLVFLNICRGDFHPSSTESVSGMLLRNGNRGVVSTSIRVPDEVAARFGGIFYDNFLYDAGATVGKALRAAKQKMLEKFCNPLGLLYTYAGDPDLVIAPSLSPITRVKMPI